VTRRRASRAAIALTVMLALGGPACGRYGPPVRRPAVTDAGAPDVTRQDAPDTTGVPDQRDKRDDRDEQEREAAPAR
jgi:hypothetical protein